MNNINFDNNLNFELIIELSAGINPKAELMVAIRKSTVILE